LNKTQELARFLLNKSMQIDFIEPRPSLQGNDTQELRRRILELTQREAKGLGIGKSTLHHLRRLAGSPRSFMIHEETRRKLILCSNPETGSKITRSTEV